MKTIPDSDEQWLLDGICRECRRKDFCSKPCKRNKVRTEREIMAYIYGRTGIGAIHQVLRRLEVKDE